MSARNQNLALLTATLVSVMLSANAHAGDRPEECLIRIKTYVISGSAGREGLSFPIFPNVSLAVFEETITDLDTYYEKLKSLYAFTEYRLLVLASARVRLAGFPRATATMERDQPQGLKIWQVDWQDFGWDAEGRLQMLVRINKDTAMFLESHVSVLPGRSVILGRFADARMEEAVFAVVVPEVEVATVTEKPAGREAMGALFSDSTVAALKKVVGLPPAESKSGFGSSLTPAAEKLPAPDEFVELSELPSVIRESNPVYPESAERAGIEGKVWLQALIDREGEVRECLVRRSSGHPELDQAALDACYKFKYRPALAPHGQPVAVWVTYQVVFKLK